MKMNMELPTSRRVVDPWGDTKKGKYTARKDILLMWYWMSQFGFPN